MSATLEMARAEIRVLEEAVAWLRSERDRLRSERDQWRTIALEESRAATLHHRLHLEERQHANELAEVLRITVRDWCPGQVFVPILDRHQASRLEVTQ